jgi:hypothetical protein
MVTRFAHEGYIGGSRGFHRRVEPVVGKMEKSQQKGAMELARGSWVPTETMRKKRR